MTVISHTHKFIFVRPYKVASRSILLSLSSWCGKDDVFRVGAYDVLYRPDTDDDAIGAVQFRNNDNAILGDLTINESWKNGHIPPGIIREKAGDRVWGEYFKFTVIRNPWDWFISLYWWRRSRWLEREIQPVRAMSPKAPIYYVSRHWRNRLNRYRAGQGIGKESVERALRRKWLEADLARWPRFYFMDGMPYADCYLRFEHLQGDFNRVCQRLGLPVRVLPRTNSRIRPKGVDYRDYYTDWSRDYIGRRFREIVDAFGYSF